VRLRACVLLLIRRSQLIMQFNARYGWIPMDFLPFIRSAFGIVSYFKAEEARILSFVVDRLRTTINAADERKLVVE
jgi:hypothetical protein